jgi:hypothetical protein
MRVPIRFVVGRLALHDHLLAALVVEGGTKLPLALGVAGVVVRENRPK